MPMITVFHPKRGLRKLVLKMKGFQRPMVLIYIEEVENPGLEQVINFEPDCGCDKLDEASRSTVSQLVACRDACHRQRKELDEAFAEQLIDPYYETCVTYLNSLAELIDFGHTVFSRPVKEHRKELESLYRYFDEMAKERNSAIEMINRYYREHRAVAGKAGQGKELAQIARELNPICGWNWDGKQKIVCSNGKLVK